MSETMMAQAQQQPDNKFAIPVRYGLMTGFILMFLSTVNFLYILKVNFLAFGLFALLTSLIPIIFYVIVISKQRKIMGGYISIKEAFQGVFVVILISQIIGAVYGVIYFKYIDPECVDRMKEAALNFFTKMNAPKDQIDKQISDFDKQLADSKSAGALIYATAKYIVIQSILGFICALIMKKERPQQFQ